MNADLFDLVRAVRVHAEAIDAAMAELAQAPAVERAEYVSYLLDQGQRIVEALHKVLRGDGS